MKKSQFRIFQESVLYFFLYSVIGWCYEVFLEVVVYRWGFSNRGSLLGPYCVVYGFGALLLLFSLERLKEKKIYMGKINVTPAAVFFGIIFIATLVELIASYMMEFTRGKWTWDYTRFAFNFQGRIAPNPSIRFGVGGMVFLYIVQPLFYRAADSMGERMLGIVTGVIAALLVVDIVISKFII